MRDVFFTILIIWVLWRIFSGINRSRGNFTFSNTQHNNYSEPTKKSGEFTIENPTIPTCSAKNKKNNEEGEFVDFEEIN